LTEVHNEAELNRALALGSDLIGVNHRDLKTLEIDLTLSERLRPKVPASVPMIAESGLTSGAKLRMLREKGFSGFLLGTHFMKKPDPGAALGELLAEAGDMKASR
jgi:indole-3-glycerol phosphate synthase